MIKTTPEALLNDLAHWIEAVKHDVVIAGEPGGGDMVLISGDEYRRLKRRDVQVMGPGDFTDEELEEILKAEPSAEAYLYNHELDP